MRVVIEAVFRDQLDQIGVAVQIGLRACSVISTGIARQLRVAWLFGSPTVSSQ